MHGDIGIDRDLLWACALCHDVGKPFEFSLKNKSIPPEEGLNELSVALVVFEHYYNKMGDILPEVVKLCEECIDKRMTKFRLLADICSPEQNLALYFEVEHSKTWAICFEGTDIIVAACAIDESDTPQLTDEHNEHLRVIINQEDKLVFVTDNKDL